METLESLAITEKHVNGACGTGTRAVRGESGAKRLTFQLREATCFIRIRAVRYRSTG